MIPVHTTETSTTFSVYVQPRSSRATIVGSHSGMLKIKLTAPPVSGAANKQCLQLLAKALGLPKSSLSIDAGHTSRKKQIRIQHGSGERSPSQQRALQQKISELAEKPA